MDGWGLLGGVAGLGGWGGGLCPIVREREARGERRERGEKREKRRRVGLTCHVNATSALNGILTLFDHFNGLSYGMG